MNRIDVVLEARTWIGTPFHHQGRKKSIGVDCVGVVIGVARELGFRHFDRAGYSRIPGEEFQLEVSRQLVAIPFCELLPGDLLTFAFKSHPQHIAIVTETAPVRILHSYLSARRCVEQLLDDIWRSRIRGAWRFREFA